jgi:nuclear pore complex protein Nup107
LWKTACTRAALDSRLSPTERGLYAALAPSVQTSGVLKSACRTWEDALWATISVLCEERQSDALARLGGGFWEPSGREEDEASEEEEDAWRADVEQELQALATVQVQEGLGADDPFHISQLHIILDRTDALLDDFASRLRDGAYDPESSECVSRFLHYDCLIAHNAPVADGPHCQVPDDDAILRPSVSLPTDDRYYRFSTGNTNHPRSISPSPRGKSPQLPIHSACPF